ncbi:MAG: 4'-phosphopantetheinyl transferase superfamily protein [Hydrogenophaga sp.]|nr:4'-phosphopantetheinyl transferase superfamily protein [Hydrogenophaga sp.]
MIVGIGIDSVETARFTPWKTYPRTRLQRIFSDEEINYCLANTTKSAQRFASRFAAREAFFKALATTIPGHTISLLAVCRHIKITRMPRGETTVTVDWKKLLAQEPLTPYAPFTCLISATHTKTTTTVIIMLQKKQ